MQFDLKPQEKGGPKVFLPFALIFIIPATCELSRGWCGHKLLDENMVIRDEGASRYNLLEQQMNMLTHLQHNEEHNI